jgi:hypothetical protein
LICKKLIGDDHYGVITTEPYYQLPKVHYSDDNPVIEPNQQEVKDGFSKPTANYQQPKIQST